MENNFEEYKFEKCRVRIHPGKLTEEERKALWEKATEWYVRAIERRHPGYWKRFATKKRGGDKNG